VFIILFIELPFTKALECYLHIVINVGILFSGKPQQQQPQEKEKRAGHGGSGGCPLCKERQRRRLASYIRTKSRQDSECAIEEEEETEQPQTKA
jgi:hypothetical protein